MARILIAWTCATHPRLFVVSVLIWRYVDMLEYTLLSVWLAGFVGPFLMLEGLFRMLDGHGGLRLRLMGDNTLRLICHGAPVDGLRRGSLLVSRHEGNVQPDPLSSNPFDHSVVYLLEHFDEGETGSFGVIVSKDRGAGTAAAAASASDLGGPVPDGVRMLYAGPNAALVPTSPGTRQLFPPRRVDRDRDGDGDGPPSHGIWLSGPQSAASWKSHPLYPKFRAEDPRLAAVGANIKMLQGCAGWAGGQLAGEVRTGSWSRLEPEHVTRDHLLACMVGGRLPATAAAAAAAAARSSTVQQVGQRSTSSSSGRPPPTVEESLWQELTRHPQLRTLG